MKNIEASPEGLPTGEQPDDSFVPDVSASGGRTGEPDAEMTAMLAERKSRGWSQMVVGFHARCSQSEISKFERGKAAPRPKQAQRLAEVLGLAPDALLRLVRAPQASEVDRG